MGDIPKFEDLPVRVRRSPRHRWNYLRELLSEVENPEAEPEVVTRNLTFTVNDGTNAVEGATVAIGNITGTTGSAGGCSLNGVAEGEKTVTVTAEGFENYSDTITVASDSTSFTISLTAVTPGDSQGSP
ncbi:MAG: carboxypeptidase regulatory-like domain-containing protein [Methanobrevibacter sp.]|uniref:carboxypeptidase-like regulatory domain-containing protein n=1 Tax=Methanobrevibacter sp. TaxID=66852 RepID=UPI0025CE3EC2|nr:carboxypeptidase-like regulatory domain-containing protein [Methanobrevibacter sp.]MBE6508253.1 carboxypeptidase regulatory-like domain-containing protein [Methanobrevibacter sp.]